MNGRPLVLAVVAVLLTFVLGVRLFEIQIGQGEVWAGEAARLVRSGTLLPYRRGAILDADDRVLVRDQATYRLELSYRAFRRNHALGLVAHARSALEARPVPLPEALEALETWALELGELSPSDLERFGRGGGLQTATLAVGPDLEPEETRRARRASDVRFYVAQLFGLRDREARELRKLAQEGTELPSYLELVAGLSGTTKAEVEARLVDEVRRARRHLELLGEHLVGESDSELRRDPLVAITDDLEAVRTAVEELVAASLFREAAGFSPGRLHPETLNLALDLSWIARALYWDGDRLAQWVEETRRRWVSWRDGYAVPRLLVEYLSRGDGERTPERLLALLSTVHAEAELLEAVLDRTVAVPARPGPAVLPRLGERFGVEDARGAVDLAANVAAVLGERSGDWRALEGLVDRIDVTDDLGQYDKQKAWRVEQLRRALRSPDRLSRFDLELLAGELVPHWERGFQDALAGVLDDALDRAERDGTLAPNGRLAFDDEHRERALESLRDVLRDYGDRSLALDQRPPYEAVYLLTRFPDEYAGFRAVDARLRVRSGTQLFDDGPSLAAGWSEVAAEVIGGISAVGVDAIQRQRRPENRLRELRSRTRTPEEDEELRQLVGEVFLHDESRGVSGIEGEWDEVLRGRHGYRERRGLVDRFGRGRATSTLSHREDGHDVALTIDAELQHATEWMLEHPVYDARDDKVDVTWFREPVGAIVMLSIEGDVVVSASVPNAISSQDPDLELQRADRSHRIDRTIRKPGFLPPGSVFKPFVALWALEHLGLDPSYEVECRRDGRQPAEYGGVRCWNTNGHGWMNLVEALKHSCNCYFAWLGDTYPSVAEFRAMSLSMGFGLPTGLRRGDARSGLYEEYVPELFTGRRLVGREPRLAANGLSVVEATPMQVARAFLALATGELPALRNVRAIGGSELPAPPPLEIDVSPATFRFVRNALYRVSNERGGTAHTALNRDQLGIEVVVKTGSADLTARVEEGEAPAVGAPKHTWVAGWLPPEDPTCVFVVFLDRARATSSHTAVYVARQFLRLPETRAWIRERGVELGEPTLEGAVGGERR